MNRPAPPPPRLTAALALLGASALGCAGAAAGGASGEARCTVQNEAAACLELAGREADAAKKRALLERACNGGSADGCFGAGELAAKAAAEDEARTAFSRACEMGHAKGCLESGRRWLGVAQERERARAHLIVSCDKNVGPACYLLGRVFEEDGELVAAEKRFVAACDFGVGAGCGAVAFQKLELAVPLSDPAREREALSWFERGCSQDDEAACGILRRLREQPLARGARYTLARVQKADGGGVRLRQAGVSMPPVGVAAKVEPFGAGRAAQPGASVRDSGTSGLVLGNATGLDTGDMVWVSWEDAPRAAPAAPPAPAQGGGGPTLGPPGESSGAGAPALEKSG